MAEAKTKPTDVPVSEFLANVDDQEKRADSDTLVKLMQEVTGEPPVMWGPSMVGFGKYAYRYDSGHSGESILAGFSPRKRELSIYIVAGFEGEPELMKKLGKYRTGRRERQRSAHATEPFRKPSRTSPRSAASCRN